MREPNGLHLPNVSTSKTLPVQIASFSLEPPRPSATQDGAAKEELGHGVEVLWEKQLANISTYTKVALLAFMIYGEGTFMDCCRDRGFHNHAHSEHGDHDHDHQFSDHLPSIGLEPEYLQGLFEGTENSVRR